MIHDRRYTGSFFQQKPRCGASEEPILVSREKERKKDTACIIVIIVSAPPGRGRWRVTRTGIWLDRESKSIWIADGRTGGPWWDAVDQPTQQVSLNHAMRSQPTPPQNHPPLSTRGPVVVGNKPTWMGDPLELPGITTSNKISRQGVSEEAKSLRRA